MATAPDTADSSVPAEDCVQSHLPVLDYAEVKARQFPGVECFQQPDGFSKVILFVGVSDLESKDGEWEGCGQQQAQQCITSEASTSHQHHRDGSDATPAAQARAPVWTWVDTAQC